MTWGEAAYRRFKDQSSRDYAVFRQQQAEAANQRNKEIDMSKRKTAHGDRVPKFPDVSGRDDRIAKVRALMAEAYDTAEAERDRRTRMAAPSADLSKRFNAIRNGAI